LTKDYIIINLREILKDCHEGEFDKAVDWIWENIVPKKEKE